MIHITWVFSSDIDMTLCLAKCRCLIVSRGQVKSTCEISLPEGQIDDIETDKHLLHNRPDVVLINYKEQTGLIIDIAVPRDKNIHVVLFSLCRNIEFICSVKTNFVTFTFIDYFVAALSWLYTSIECLIIATAWSLLVYSLSFFTNLPDICISYLLCFYR